VGILIGIVPEFCLVFQRRVIGFVESARTAFPRQEQISSHEIKISTIFSFIPALSATVFDYIQLSAE
jgi:hypothetical protein